MTKHEPGPRFLCGTCLEYVADGQAYDRLREINADLLEAVNRALQYVGLAAADAKAEGNADLAKIAQDDFKMISAARDKAEGQTDD